jgi:hypothetical protein
VEDVNNMSKSSKKISKDDFTPTVYGMLGLFKEGAQTPAMLLRKFDISKQDLNYWLKKCCESSILEKTERGIYELTESGKKIHDEYWHYKGKQLIRLENMRLACQIQENGEVMIRDEEWEKQYELKNGVKIYQTHIQGHFIKITSSKMIKIEIACKQYLDTDYYGAFLGAAMGAIKVLDDICSKYNMSKVNLPVVTSKPEFAIPHDFSEALLSITGASQITTNRGKMNRSKGRNADWEPMDLQYAQKIVDMPETIEAMNQTISEMSEIIKKQKSVVVNLGNYPMFL